MDAFCQQPGERLVDQPVPPHARLPGERGGDDLDREVAFAARIVARVAAMLGAVIDHGEPFGREGGLQQAGDLGRDGPGFNCVHRPYIAGFGGNGRLADGARSPRFHGRIEGDRPCSEPGCVAPGEFRAPAEYGARPGFDGPGDWRWLCLDHVRAFNARYNFFTGMSPDEIAAQQRPYAGWERETRAFSTAGADRPPAWADFTDPLEAIQGRFRSQRAAAAERQDGRPLSGEERRALKTLGLEIDADRRTLRQRYSDLVRRYHPDRNGGDRSHEQALGEVIAAYQRLKGSALFA